MPCPKLKFTILSTSDIPWKVNKDLPNELSLAYQLTNVYRFLVVSPSRYQPLLQKHRNELKGSTNSPLGCPSTVEIDLGFEKIKKETCWLFCSHLGTVIWSNGFLSSRFPRIVYGIWAICVWLFKVSFYGSISWSMVSHQNYESIFEVFLIVSEKSLRILFQIGLEEFFKAFF